MNINSDWMGVGIDIRYSMVFEVRGLEFIAFENSSLIFLLRTAQDS